MPELPEVESVRRLLKDCVIDKEIISVNIQLPRIVRSGNLNDLVGLKFEAIDRIGKYLKFNTSGKLTMYSHFRMSGTFYWRKEDDDSLSHIRASIRFEDGIMLYRDIRTFGGLWIFDDASVPWTRIGVDPFSPDFSTEFISVSLKSRSTPIKVALLDQHFIAGIGNIYASEILFQAKINPASPANSLGFSDYAKIQIATVDILQASIDSGGTTFRDFQLSNGRDGAFKDFLKVYGKAGSACQTCGTEIVKIVLAQRSSYFCPSCQPE